ncbi:S41 family peptidase [Tsuneonella suprasediminis]|uniref:S41 family peptidase n=1 Tax=Tsuneonella suprasediminis TaxID=2306996 RepID=UPI002F932835
MSERQNWVKSQLDEWYLFPTLLNNSVTPSAYTNVQDYIDALVAPARAQSKDRYFTYITSIAEENAYYNSGSTAGLGVRLALDSSSNRLFVVESFESGPALGVGIDRGTEILAIGTVENGLQKVSSLVASGGTQALSDALGPNDPGVSRVLQVYTNGQVSNVTVTKTTYNIDPVSNRYGAKVIDDNGTKVGYINLRTFIDSADADLRTAMDTFRSQGIDKVIVDLRYNGGGLVDISVLFGDLLGKANVGKVFSYTTYRDSKSSRNTTTNFSAQAQAIAPTKIAFIGMHGTASASELLTNAFIPYLGNNMALVGTNTYGKPVGQIGLDRSACDDRLRVMAFKTENADHQGEYFTGLATVVPNTCAAGDDIFHQLGDPSEAATRAALNFLSGQSCTPITSSASGTRTQAATPRRTLITPARPSAAQHETPGLF